ncbi:MAG: SUMF1/EgtB/PvdO family nonheme iron enzyme [Hyphomonadaceae bacterium]
MKHAWQLAGIVLATWALTGCGDQNSTTEQPVASDATAANTGRPAGDDNPAPVATSGDGITTAGSSGESGPASNSASTIRTFRDCASCPEMALLPGGSFTMGDIAGKGYAQEKPPHEVMIARPFAIGVYEVTFAEWDACVADGGCDGYRPSDAGWGRDKRPVINVSWYDAKAYTDWLSAKTGKPYRLPSEAEWEFAARAGTSTLFWWGNEVGQGHANCPGCGSQWDGTQTAPVGSFSPNAFGLYDTAGNALEWVEDCGSDNYNETPTDGAPNTSCKGGFGRL